MPSGSGRRGARIHTSCAVVSGTPWTARSPSGALRSSATGRAGGRSPSPIRRRAQRPRRRPRGRWRARRGGTAVASCAAGQLEGRRRLPRFGVDHQEAERSLSYGGATPLAPTSLTHFHSILSRRCGRPVADRWGAVRGCRVTRSTSLIGLRRGDGADVPEVATGRGARESVWIRPARRQAPKGAGRGPRFLLGRLGHALGLGHGQSVEAWRCRRSRSSSHRRRAPIIHAPGSAPGAPLSSEDGARTGRPGAICIWRLAGTRSMLSAVGSFVRGLRLEVTR
jgi:hypothetical protein